MPLHLVIFGRQGAGKGTQSSHISENFGVVHVSTGDMLRAAIEAGTELGLAAQKIMDAGELVDDTTMVGIVRERLSEADVVDNGVLLDGFPRTPAQAEELTLMLGERAIDAAVNLEVPVEVVTERMLERGRADDTAEAIAQRLDLYESQTRPVLDWFDERDLLVEVDGVGQEADVAARVRAALESATTHSGVGTPDDEE